jgi:hypothetical protein
VGAVVACNTVGGPAPDAGLDAGPVTTTTPPVPPTPPSTDASAPDSGDAGYDAAPISCAATSEPTGLPWAPPTPLQPGKCTTQNVTDMQAYLKQNPATTNEQFEAYVKTQSTSCHDCMFTDGGLPTWGPIPLSGGRVLTQNIGACYAIRSGNVACGKARQNVFDCQFFACATCPDTASFKACETQVLTGACSFLVQAVQTACAGVSPTVDASCGTVFDSVTAQCVGP